MKHSLVACGLAIACTFTYACKKKKHDSEAPVVEETPTPVTYQNYSQLKTGNYWIYQEFAIDPQGNASATNTFDSCYVQKDTVIRNNTYHKIYNSATSYLPFVLLRDSLAYTINETGFIIFSSVDYTSFEYIQIAYPNPAVPADTVSKTIYKTADRDLPITTPAGTFITSDLKETITMYPPYVNGFNPRYRHRRCAKNIGVIIETGIMYTSATNYTERRLVRYHLN